METSFIAYLLAQAGITALVDTRIYWHQRPQSSHLPSITLQIISGVPVNSDDGADPLKETRVQIDCWGTTFSAALNAAAAVETVLSGLSFTHGSTEFQAVYMDSQDSGVETSATGSAIHRVRTDYILWWRAET